MATIGSCAGWSSSSSTAPATSAASWAEFSSSTSYTRLCVKKVAAGVKEVEKDVLVEAVVLG